MGKQVVLDKDKKAEIKKELKEGNVRFNLHKGLRERQYEAWQSLNEALEKLSNKKEFKEAV